jgi:hypothetical protein
MERSSDGWNDYAVRRISSTLTGRNDKSAKTDRRSKGAVSAVPIGLMLP